MRRRLWCVLAAAAALLAAGCTGVPTSSRPQAVQSVRLGPQSADQPITPAPDASPRDLISEFMYANAADPGASARLFLTKQANSGWRTDTATIISGQNITTYNTSNGTISVVARVIGTLNSAGIYRPSLDGDGNGGAQQAFQFTLELIGGQYRISHLNPGLLLILSQFQTDYVRYPLYFFDDSQPYLVQDPRYRPIGDPKQAALWLLQQLAAGPQQQLQNAVTSSFPVQGATTKNTLTPGSPTVVDIPGAGQLDSASRRQLAAQVSETLSEPLTGVPISITDNGAPVRIEGLGDTFVASDFSGVASQPAPPASVYYLSHGQVYDQHARRLAGPLGNGTYDLTSIGMGKPGPSEPTLVAAVEGTGDQRRLYTGTVSGGLHATTVHGALTRPAFVPGLPEVWEWDGKQIQRITLDPATGRFVVAHPVSILQGPTTTISIQALRISPDGARVAIVLDRGAGQGGQLLVGALDRNAGQVHVDQPTPISPQKTSITDVAWLNSVKLYAVGRVSTTTDPQSFDTQVDGSYWSAHSLGLSSAADSVTVAAQATVWVSASGYVWEQSAGQGVGQWVAPAGGQTGGQTSGTNPVYVE